MDFTSCIYLFFKKKRKKKRQRLGLDVSALTKEKLQCKSGKGNSAVEVTEFSRWQPGLRRTVCLR